MVIFKKIIILEFLNNRYGYYVREGDMDKIAKQFPTLKTKRTTDIFLNFVTDSKKIRFKNLLILQKNIILEFIYGCLHFLMVKTL